MDRPVNSQWTFFQICRQVNELFVFEKVGNSVETIQRAFRIYKARKHVDQLRLRPENLFEPAHKI